MWHHLKAFVGMKAKYIIGLWSLGMLGLSMYVGIRTRSVPTSVAAMFSTVITGLVATKVGNRFGKDSDANKGL